MPEEDAGQSFSPGGSRQGSSEQSFLGSPPGFLAEHSSKVQVHFSPWLPPARGVFQKHQNWPSSSSQGGSQHRPGFHCCWYAFAGVPLLCRSSLLARGAHFDRFFLLPVSEDFLALTDWPASTSQRTGGGTFTFRKTSVVLLKLLFPRTEAIQRPEIIPFCSLWLIRVQVGAGTGAGKY